MTEAKAPVPVLPAVFPPAVSDPELERRLGRGLGRVEERLEACTARVADPRMAGIVGHLLAADGERLRPLLALLGSEFGPGGAEGAADAGAVAELVHTASLHHVDVMDRAPVRHGVPSANALWGNRLAVLAGDWLLGQAARIAVGLGPEAVRLHAGTAERLVLGRSRKATAPGPGTDAVEHRVEAAGRTAALFSMALSIGALQAGAPRYVVRDLGEFGELLGTAAVDGCPARAREVLVRLPDNPAREALDSLCDSVPTGAA
ncbi:polyprenyl synthetase family protein [Streptomyces scopuliridis]|uniref:polyprenyl synthetase family protein n=1 Tax=Streptomyces scopuliridis TaxID=452529 RepID=UPI003675673E